MEAYGGASVPGEVLNLSEGAWKNNNGEDFDLKINGKRDNVVYAS
jgi:hypothetical protein